MCLKMISNNVLINLSWNGDNSDWKGDTSSSSKPKEMFIS